MNGLGPDQPGSGTVAGGSTRRRARWIWVGVGLVALTAVLVATFTWSPSGDGIKLAPAQPGGAAHAFSLEDVRAPKRQLSLAEYFGRPVVLNFWASWCVPCQREMPAFESAHRQLGARVVFIGVDTKDARRAARDFLQETGVTYDSGYDPDGTVADAYGLYGLPSTVFISANGKIVDRHSGEIAHDQLLELIAKRLGIRPAT